MPGFEPGTSSLPRMRSNLLSYMGDLSHIKKWWRGEDSNLRRRLPTDLQSAPFDRSGTSPLWSRRRESNPRPADYKSAALPAELHRHPIGLSYYNFVSFLCQLFILNFFKCFLGSFKAFIQNTLFLLCLFLFFFDFLCFSIFRIR
jgi:hypothetical protein